MSSKNIQIAPFNVSTDNENGHFYKDLFGINNGGGISEIEEDDDELARGLFELDIHSNKIPLSTIREEVTGGSGSLFSFDFHNNGDVVYVEIGKHEDTSMDGLVWTMSHVVDPASTVFLIHIFPEIKQIPTLLGMMPIDQANPEQKEVYLAQERGRRREYLQKFLNVCSASKAKVDTILIESNTEGKAILDLIPILNIRKLVVGTSKRNIRSRKIGGTAGQILRGAPEDCEVKIICEGKELTDLVAESPRASNAQSSPNFSIDQDLGQNNANNNYSLWGSCFKPKVSTSAT